MHQHESGPGRHCCCEGGNCGGGGMQLSRRQFLEAGGIALGAVSLGDLAWNSVLAAETNAPARPQRSPLVVKAVLGYDTPKPRPQTSWRNWGGIHTEEAAKEELGRIQGELDKIGGAADFPVKFLPVSGVKSAAEMSKLEDLASADAIIVYAAGGWGMIETAVKTGKPVIIFLRHRSGPVYLWYEIVSPRYLHQHKDALGVTGIDNGDVVVDSLDELSWRLRALCGLKNALGTKMVCIGGPSGWSTPKAPDIAKTKWKLDLQTVSYPELKPLLDAAMQDAKAMKDAADRAAEYLKDPGVKLEVDKVYVEHAFLLETVFRGLMAKAGTTAMTINNCMGAIMPISKTTACLTLSLLNDAGYMAFCESDFVVIPAGLLLCGISGRPVFLNDPTYPHAGVITLAHCTAPRRNDGVNLDPARIVTHFESDYGASPKVEFRKGQKVTNIIPDFASVRYVGLSAEIVDVPFLPICRSQMDVAYKVPDEKVALNMPGFHWQTMYGDYLKEFGYALKKTAIGWECLG